MKLSTQILLAFSMVLLLSAVDSAANYLLSQKVKQNIDFLENSQNIIRNSRNLHKTIIEMQSAFRSYLITGNGGFLEEYKEGFSNVTVSLNKQKNAVSSNGKQVAILDSITALNLEWTTFASEIIDAHDKTIKTDSFRNTYNKLYEKNVKNQLSTSVEISQKFIDFDKSEYELRSVHSGLLITSIQLTHTLSLIFLMLTLIVGICSTVYIVRLITRRIKSMVLLAEGISKGNFTVVTDKANDELTSLSASLNIMSANLNRTIRELEKRNLELDKFAHVVSHDLKAPIRGIHNVVKWIEEDLGDEISPQMKRYLSIIPQRTKRMENLINGLLDYARLREKIKPEMTDVNEMVREIVDAVVPRNFKVEINPLPVFATERLRLEQVMTNLISNAVKYTASENGEITISCKTFPTYYEFAVKDNGIGIEAEYHEKIFELFQTLREKDEKESTGIGLAIIKKIIDDLHCSIRVNSSLGAGAEFVFTWPR